MNAHIPEMKMITKLLQNKFKINSFALIIAAVIYLFLFFIPATKALLAKLAECRAVKAQLAAVYKDAQQTDAFKAKIAQLGEKINYYEKKLPGEKEIPAILENLSQAAQCLDIQITEIKPLEQIAMGEQIYYSVPISLNAECGYHQLGRFVNALEKADRFMKISDISIEANPQENSIHNVALIVVTYVLRK